MDILSIGIHVVVICVFATGTTAIKDACDFQSICENGTVKANPNNCSGYYECTSILDRYYGFQWLVKQCPSGMQFNYKEEICQDGYVSSKCHPGCQGIVGPTVDLKLVQRLINGSTAEGNTAQFICSFQILNLLGSLIVPRFQWYLNNQTIVNIGRKKMIETDKNFDNHQTINSTLTFDSLSLADSGSVSCKVLYNNQLDSVISKDYFLVVLVRPRISIYPLTLDVLNLEEFVLNCTVINYLNGTTVTYTWYQNGIIEFILKKDSQTSTIKPKLEAGQSSMIYGCIAATDNGTSTLQTSTVNALKVDDKVCVNEKDAERSFNWPRTRVNNVNYQPCPGNKTGTCSRKCSTDSHGSPTWLNTNCDGCVNKKFTYIFEQIDRAEKGIGVNTEDVAKIAKSLANVTNDTLGLSTGDLNASLNAVDRLTILREDRSHSPNRAEINSVVTTLSNMIQPTNKVAWNNLRLVNDTAAATVLKSADVYGNRLALAINQSIPIREVAENMVLEARSLSSENLTSEIRFPFEDVEKFDTDIENNNWISLPPTALNLNLIGTLSNISVKIWGSYYRNLDEYLPGTNYSILDSRILSFSVENVQKLQQPVTIALSHNNRNRTQDMEWERQCVFWNFDNVGGGNWSDVGCRVKTTNSNQTVCLCDHLTNFAILMSRNPSDDIVLSIISNVGCIISVVALILTVIVYVVTWRQSKSDQAAVLLNLCVALIIANIIFLAGADKVKDKDGCIAVAVLLHYFFLAAFFIMLAEGVELLLYVIFVFHVRRKIETTMLIVAAWVLPLIIVAISLGATKTSGYGGKKSCWLAVDNGLIWAFIGPAICIIAVNLVIFFVVLWRVAVARLPSNKKEKNSKIRGTLWNISVICPILGITWIIGIFSASSDSVVFQYIFAIANSLQGLFIFIFHALFHNQKINEKISTLFSQIISHSRSAQSDSSQQTVSKNNPENGKTPKGGYVPTIVNHYEELGQKNTDQGSYVNFSNTILSSELSNTECESNTNSIEADADKDMIACIDLKSNRLVARKL